MIFLNLLNKIFGPKEAITRQEIDAYKSGEGDLHAIEEKAAHAAINESSLQGWGNVSASVNDEMTSLDDKMNHYLSASSSAPGKVKSIVLYAMLAAACFIFVFITYKGNQIVEEQQKIQLAENTTPQKSSFQKELNQIDSYKKITPKKLITASKLKAVETKSEAVPPQQSKVLSIPKMAPMEMDEVAQTDTAVNNQLPIQKKEVKADKVSEKLAYHQAKEIYIHGLKNVDYRAYRNSPIKTDVAQLSGVPASKDNRNSSNQLDLSPQTQEVPYIDYLTKTAEYFSTSNYKIALKRYLVILKVYPKDVNSNFYGGLCYYNLGQFEKAITLFKRSYSIGFGNFREEALWYIAKANHEQGKELKTKYFLKTIIQEGGFYKTQAQQMLSTILSSEK